ncbi:MAG TPA: hypothetical protein VFP15_10820 [Gemmatimonadaceae bacterium]|nr:hypothetical protein [Gemmatimonadaceae bacterium]
MLAAAFANWISQLTERDFDAPFTELLRSLGFYDIHFTHGAYEFGKDFIAKRDEPEPTQYAFQSKAGDIGGSEWASMFSQLYELANAGPAHPSFDHALPRKSVLVTTGRLTGKAILSAAAFKDEVQRTGRGAFDVWDVNVLAEQLDGSARFPLKASVALLPPLGLIESGKVNERELQQDLAVLIATLRGGAADAHRLFVDNTVIVARLAEKGWPFLALAAALNEVRLGAIVSHFDAQRGRELLLAGMGHYVQLGERLLAPLLEAPANREKWMEWVGGVPPRMIGYAAACAKTIEYLGLSCLHLESIGQEEGARRNASLCAEIVGAQPGCVHPISDRFAASYPPAVAAMSRFGHRAAASRLVRKTMKWIGDRYEADWGLASPYSTPDEEIRALLGVPFESVDGKKRPQSLLAVALADCAHAFLPDDYPLIVNEILAVRMFPEALHAKDLPEAYLMNAGGTQPLPNIGYPEVWSEQPLGHQALQAAARIPEVQGGPTVPLALACVLRDRLFTDVLPRLRKVP